ncbi:MAG: SpoIID/LytB domain-containing protein [Bdellovibrionales bacterium]|nr:SpoIID/LytB domain-containing protein [Bdellovibrionales bacterium]
MLWQLFQSFWLPPAKDKDLITVGIISEAPKVRFRSDGTLTITVFSEDKSFEIYSPEHVTWTVDSATITRPARVEYLPAVETRLFMGEPPTTLALVAKWKSLGFAGVQWLGPKQMGISRGSGSLDRWILSLSPPTSLKNAQALCRKGRASTGFCRVLAYTRVPLVSKGVIRAENSSFEREFEGFISVKGERLVEVLDFVPEPRTNNTSIESYSSPLYVVPVEENQWALVQQTTLGNYLKSVVPSEIFPNAPIEAVKAQAIVARTYALLHLPADAKMHPFSICSTTLCQVYRGASITQANSDRAIEETDSLVLWGQKGQPAETFYHGICGGHTEEKTEIWGMPSRSYLHGSKDSLKPWKALLKDSDVETYLKSADANTIYCGSSKYTNEERWRWERTLRTKELHKILEKINLSPPLTGLKVLKRGVSGRVLSLEIKTRAASKIIYGELKIRMLFGGLLSSLVVFKPQTRGDEIVELNIIGAGYGHGVGMCQVGAIGRAEKGQNFGEILKAYYPNTQLGTVMLK